MRPWWHEILALCPEHSKRDQNPKIYTSKRDDKHPRRLKSPEKIELLAEITIKTPPNNHEYTSTTPWMGCLSITGLPPVLNLLAPIYTPGWREAP